ncbi:MAG: sulfotransferase family protein [bacterium]
MSLLIVGSERSGTSAITTLLSIAADKKALDDPVYTWYLTPYIRMQRKVFSFRLFWDLNKYSIIKMPGFAIILFYLKKMIIREFKVVYIVRDPRDNVCSVIERLNNGINGLYLNIHYLGGEFDNFEETIAFKWNMYINEGLKFQKRYPKRIMFIKYEDFVNDKTGTIKRIGDFSKLKTDIQKIETLVDNQYRKAWSNKIGGKERYKKELSEEQINRIENICGENMRKFGYMI